MALRCPKCKAGALKVVAALELGPDKRSDEVAFQVVACTACGFEGVAVYEESRRGALDDESWSHTAWAADDSAIAAARRLIASCRRPRYATCTCPAHARARGVVRGENIPELEGVDWETPLPIHFISSR